MAEPTLRPMHAADLDAIHAIQRACYGDGFVESTALFARRLRVAPDTAWVAARDGESPCAYLSAYPTRLGKLTALHGDFEPAGDVADTLYLHDLAVHPDAHGAGLGPRLVRHALAHAAQRGWARSALVSVQGSLGFWQRLGFAAWPLQDEQQQARLKGYEEAAHYMVRLGSAGAAR